VNHEKRYIPTLDGWRAVAVIGVIFYHGQSELLGNHFFLRTLAAHGILGVDIFFGVSGFLICGLLLREYEKNEEISLRRFYIRRFLRILPPYYAALATICALGVFCALPVNFPDVPSCLLFYRNYRPLGIDAHGGFYTAHFWTLAVEEHFYLLWPALLILVKPKRAGNVAFLLAMLVFAWRTIEGHSQLLAGILPQANLMTRTDTRIDGLLWGCLAAIYFGSIQRVAARIHFSQLWLIPLAILIASQALHVPGLTLLRSIILPVMVVSTVLQPASVLGRVLEWPLVRWIGTLSYSLYLWQELFLPEVRSQMAPGAFHYLQQPPWNLVAVLVCACLSRYLIEIPMIRLGHRLSVSPLVFPRAVQSSPAPS
jgi:peptidoglycan/LPS O-acetylase OafA/YrhL